MVSPPLRIALAGAGLIGRVHLAALIDNTDCVPAAIVDPSPAARELAASHGITHCASLDELFDGVSVDAIIIATPNSHHLAHTSACIARGLPVLLEKPLTATVAEGEALVADISAMNARVLVAHHRTHSSILKQSRDVIASGELGRLVSITGSATFYKPDHYFEEAPWRTRAGGGPILINLIHEVHSLRLLCGEIAAVQAIASHAVRGYAVEDTVSINLRFESGVLGTFLLSDTAASPRSWEHNSGENPSYSHYPDQDCYVVAGTNGSLAIPTMQLHRYRNPADRSWWKPFEVESLPLERDDPIERQLAHFVKMIRGECEPAVTPADGLANLRVTEAVIEAARTGQTIEISPD